MCLKDTWLVGIGACTNQKGKNSVHSLSVLSLSLWFPKLACVGDESKRVFVEAKGESKRGFGKSKASSKRLSLPLSLSCSRKSHASKTNRRWRLVNRKANQQRAVSVSVAVAPGNHMHQQSKGKIVVVW
ncbi:hypothetical protein YC2023_058113 [Brassica napus]